MDAKIESDKPPNANGLQDVITSLLGGRQAKPYSFMTGATHFNGHLAGAEHLRIGDENPMTDMRSPTQFRRANQKYLR